MPQYQRCVTLPVGVEEAFAWHERPGALDRLIPPWENIVVRQRPAGLAPGSRAVLEQRLGPIPLRWKVEHREYVPPHWFRDVQLSGPFAEWDHTHRFTADDDGLCVLEDDVRYALPAGGWGQRLGGGFVGNQIDQMFRYRHRVTHDDLAAHRRFRDRPALRIAITGSSGLVGTALVAMLRTGGHQVHRMVRSDPQDDQIGWSPGNGKLEPADLEGIDAVVNLAGESIASGRWTTARRQRIMASRVEGTRLLCETLAKLRKPPSVLVNASAIGYYGDRGDETLNETSSSGTNFLADVCRQWEGATQPASESGIRVAFARFGMILHPRSGALSKMLTPFRLGGGGNVGNGEQYWSWVSHEDAVDAIHFCLMEPSISGPVNVAAPQPVDNREFTKVLGQVLYRPTLLPLPEFALRVGLGEMADELLLASARVMPDKLKEHGFSFRYPDLESALRHLLGRRQAEAD